MTLFLAFGDVSHRLVMGLPWYRDPFEISHRGEPGLAILERSGIQGPEVIGGLADTDEFELPELLDSALDGAS